MCRLWYLIVNFFISIFFIFILKKTLFISGCQISLSNFTKCDTVLYCKTHYFKRFHEEGSYLGGDKFENKNPRDSKLPISATSNISSTPTPTPTPDTDAPISIQNNVNKKITDNQSKQMPIERSNNIKTTRPQSVFKGTNYYFYF